MDKAAPEAVASEVARLQEALRAICQATRPGLDGSALLQFDPEVARSLHGIVEECQGLQRYTEEVIGRQRLEVQAQGVSGDVVRVDVNPETETVAGLKRRIAEQRGVLPAMLRLFERDLGPRQAEHAEALRTLEAARLACNEARQEYFAAQEAYDRAQAACDEVAGNMQMANTEKLSKYNLVAGVTIAVVDLTIENEMLRLTFDDPQRLEFESVSETSGTWLNSDQKGSVQEAGRRGINFQGHCVLKLAEPIFLGSAWTISIWTLAPIDTTQAYRNLLDDTGDNRILLAIVNKQIGDVNLGAYVQYDASTLAAGWHHIAAVGAANSVSYYVDGEVIGHRNGQTQGRISSVGNRGDGHCAEAWGVMSDLRIFGAAASDDQIRFLFQSSAALTR